MSFSRAAVKRFNETNTAAPAPGHYDIKDSEKAVGAIKFDFCADRFKNENESGSSKDFTVPSSSSKRKLNFNKAKTGNDRVRTPTPNFREKEGHEREIRKLLQQNSEREHDLKNARDELQRLQSKVSALTKEKSLKESRCAALEKSSCMLQKENDILKANSEKTSSLKKIELELKEAKIAVNLFKQECASKQTSMDLLQTDLHEVRSKISALEEANKILEKFNRDVQKHADDVTGQVTKLQGITDKLRCENNSLQDRLESTQAMLLQSDDTIRTELPSSLTKFLADFESSSRIAEDGLTALNERIVFLNEQIRKLSQIIIPLQCERNTLLKDLTELKGTLADFETKQSELEEENMGLITKIEERETELSSAKSEIFNLTQKLACLQTDFDSASSSHRDEIAAMTTHFGELKQDLENEVEKTNDLSAQIENLVCENKEMKAEAESRVQELEQIKTELNQRSSENEVLENEREELQSKFEKLTEERKLETESNAALRDEIEQCKTNLSESKEQLLSSDNRCSELEEALKIATEKMEEESIMAESMRQRSKDLEEIHEAKLSEFTRRIMDTQKKLNQRDLDLKDVKRQNEILSKIADQLAEKENVIERLKTEKQSLECDLSQVSTELQEIKLSEKEDKTGVLIEELERWKCLYEELEEKVKPFQRQLDAYSAEKAFLVSKTSAAQAEANKLGKKYAELLGHQNHKQKIKHIVKLKEQNMDLRDENQRLRVQVASLQKQVVDNRKPRFDPSKAFQHHKENSNPNTACK